MQAASADKPKPKIDISSLEYKQAERKWISTMIALPILLVTSYLLFDRCEYIEACNFCDRQLLTHALRSGLGQRA